MLRRRPEKQASRFLACQGCRQLKRCNDGDHQNAPCAAKIVGTPSLSFSGDAVGRPQLARASFARPAGLARWATIHETGVGNRSRPPFRHSMKQTNVPNLRFSGH
ncbi:hypothetical protein DP42_4637 [Burkholderia pseudomallei]|nr:hypothetical protein DP42_4637 [Burkholderia pseudomallei]